MASASGGLNRSRKGLTLTVGVGIDRFMAKQNVVVLTYLPKGGANTVQLKIPFSGEEDERRDILRGATAVFGQPDEHCVQRDVDLSEDRDG